MHVALWDTRVCGPFHVSIEKIVISKFHYYKEIYGLRDPRRRRAPSTRAGPLARAWNDKGLAWNERTSDVLWPFLVVEVGDLKFACNCNVQETCFLLACTQRVGQ